MTQEQMNEYGKDARVATPEELEALEQQHIAAGRKNAVVDMSEGHVTGTRSEVNSGTGESKTVVTEGTKKGQEVTGDSHIETAFKNNPVNKR